MQVQNITNSRYQNFSSLQVKVAKGQDHNAFYRAYSHLIGSQVGSKDGIMFNLGTQAKTAEEVTTASEIRKLGHKVAETEDDWWNHRNELNVFS